MGFRILVLLHIPEQRIGVVPLLVVIKSNAIRESRLPSPASFLRI
jgi:hypothetical protein